MKHDPAPGTVQTPAHTAATWPFGELTPHQARQHAEQLQAMRAGELRRIPTVFGDLDEGEPT